MGLHPKTIISKRDFWPSTGKTYNTQQGRDACSAVLVLLNRGWELMHWLCVVTVISTALDGVGIWRHAWSGRSVGSDSALPGLLEKEW